MSDFDRVAVKFQALSRDLDGAGLRRIVTSVAVAAKRDIDDKVARDLGSDRRMSNWSRIKFTSGFELTSDHSADLLPRPVGPWFVLDQGRRGKPAAFPRGRRRRKLYNTPFGLRTATRERPWPSTKSTGKNTFSDALTVIRRETPRRIDDETVKSISMHFTRGI